MKKIKFSLCFSSFLPLTTLISCNNSFVSKNTKEQKFDFEYTSVIQENMNGKYFSKIKTYDVKFDNVFDKEFDNNYDFNFFKDQNIDKFTDFENMVIPFELLASIREYFNLNKTIIKFSQWKEKLIIFKRQLAKFLLKVGVESELINEYSSFSLLGDAFSLLYFRKYLRQGIDFNGVSTFMSSKIENEVVNFTNKLFKTEYKNVREIQDKHYQNTKFHEYMKNIFYILGGFLGMENSFVNLADLQNFFSALDIEWYIKANQALFLYRIHQEIRITFYYLNLISDLIFFYSPNFDTPDEVEKAQKMDIDDGMLFLLNNHYQRKVQNNYDHFKKLYQSFWNLNEFPYLLQKMSKNEFVIQFDIDYSILKLDTKYNPNNFYNWMFNFKNANLFYILE
ncbi:hypothetical protein C4M81_02830, partial [Mycoplasmopsis pullorum]|uniref:hypothetical protein n=1 Tax=Mycoplasmopsis pullorum TaxID=48003 RepID=UPI00111AA878